MDIIESKKIGTMSEMLHKCLRCNELAYEVEEGFFKCSDKNCGFEWEVKSAGKGSL